MLDSIREFSAAYSSLLTMIVATALVIVFLVQRRIRLWVTDFWVTFPFVGVIARLAKDTTRGTDGWLRSEEKLCGIYKPYVSLMSEQVFRQRIEYLRRASDLGRIPTPAFVWVLLIVLVVAEGLGFSYLLGSWMAREGSADTHNLLMFAIVLVLCVIMVAITHFAGHQTYRTSLLRSCFKKYKDTGADEYGGSSEMPDLDTPQSIDDHQPVYARIVNRVATTPHDKGSYGGLVIAIISILVIGGGSTYMRVKNFESERIREASLQAKTQSSNPFANMLPAEVTAPQAAADSKARQESDEASKDEGMAAFVILGFIFVITQIVGMGAGYKFGFAGKQSKKAYSEIGGFETYNQYITYFRPLRDLANSRMKDLQQRVEENSHQKLSLTKTFDDYLKLSAHQESSLINDLKEGSTKVELQRDMLPRNQPMAPLPASAASIDDIKAEMVRLNNADAEKAYFLTLPESVRSNPEVIEWLKARKASRSAAVQAEELF